MPGTLYIVSTPIGNLGDMSFRAVATLKEVDIIYCEDTRVTKKLLNYFEITTPTESYHQHSSVSKSTEILNLLKEGKSLALVSDAGTPGISDPGGELVKLVRQDLPEVNVVPVPGASAIMSGLAVSGLKNDKFVFMGFPPHKNKRQKFFKEVAEMKYTVVLYESSHRIKKTLTELAQVLPPETKAAVGRELTKKFETFYFGSIQELAQKDMTPKGEFIIIIEK